MSLIFSTCFISGQTGVPAGAWITQGQRHSVIPPRVQPMPKLHASTSDVSYPLAKASAFKDSASVFAFYA